MYDHIGLQVKNLDKSVRFYEAVLSPLGGVITSRDTTYAGFGPSKDCTVRGAAWAVLNATRAKTSDLINCM